MPDESEGFLPDTPSPERSKTVPPKSGNAKVRRVTDGDYHPVVFEHESEGTAREYIKRNHPRGAEVYLETADGKKQHYSADLDAQGHEEAWSDWARD